MFIAALCCGIVPFIAGITVYFNSARNKDFHQSAAPIALTAAILPPLIFFLYNLHLVASRYNGLCEGPPDYSAACSYTEYMNYHLFNGVEVFGYGLLCTLSLGWMGLVLGMVGVYFKNENPRS